MPFWETLRPYPSYPMWEQGGVWVPYLPVPYMQHQGRRMSAGHAHNEPHHFKFIRLSYAQWSLSHTGSTKPVLAKSINLVLDKRKWPLQQVYVPKKKVEALILQSKQTNEPKCIKINFTNVMVKEIDGLIVICNIASSDVKEALVGAAINNGEAGTRKIASKWCQLKWCPSGLNKTERQKLQHSQCNKLKCVAIEKQRE